MARRPSQVRKRRRSRQLMVEGLESRQLLAANVAVASEAGPASTPLVLLVNAETGVEQARIMAFDETFKGGVRLAMGRVTGNVAPDIVAASGSGRIGAVRVFKPVTSGDTTTLEQVLSFRPFGATYQGGIEVAVGDVDGDTVEDIVVAKSREGGDVKVFRMTNSGGTPTATLYATIANPFGASYNGGSSVAVADVGTFANGGLVNTSTLSGTKVADGKGEIVIGSGAGIPAQVRVYDISRPAAPRVADTITPFGPLFQGGVSVTSGRYNVDFIDDIVVSAGRGGAAQTRVFDGTVGTADNTVLKTFTTYGSTERPNAAVYAAAIDSTNDGQMDRFLVTQGDPGGPAGIARVSAAGTRSAGAVTTIVGPLRIAAARPFTTITAVVSNPSPSASVAAGSTRSMQYRDVEVGTGVVATNGKSLSVRYTGKLADGTVFETGTFSLVLGAHSVIPGWDYGLVGMKVGGKRQLVIPPELAYGDAGQGKIPGGATLLFDVELLSVN